MRAIEYDTSVEGVLGRLTFLFELPLLVTSAYAVSLWGKGLAELLADSIIQISGDSPVSIAW